MMKKISQLIIYLTIIAAITACGPNNVNENWFFTEIFHYDGIALDREIKQIYPLNEDTVFFLGTDRGLVDCCKETAFFFRSTDGGKTVEKQILGNGYLEELSFSDDKKTMFLIRSCVEDSSNIADKYDLLKSTDLGKTWITLPLFRNQQLFHVYFEDENVGFALTFKIPRDNSPLILCKTIDGGVHWEKTTFDVKTHGEPYMIYKGKLWGILKGSHKTIWSMDIHSLEFQILPLQISNELGVWGNWQIDPTTGKLYVCLKKKQGDVAYFVYCIDDGRTVQLATPKDWFDWYVYGDYIGIMYDVEGYVTKYRYSYNFGRTWHTETPPEYLTWGAPAMYGEGHVWIIANAFIHSKGWPLMVRVPQESDKK